MYYPEAAQVNPFWAISSTAYGVEDAVDLRDEGSLPI